MGFLDDFIFYGSGTECPEPFLTWSGLSLLGAVAGRRTWYQHGDYFPIYPNMYVCLVGTAGSGKSAAMGLAEKLFLAHFPTYSVSASIQSREDILFEMGKQECEKYWTDETGEFSLSPEGKPMPGTIHAFRPFYAIVDELSNFVSVDKEKMIGTLVGIYGRDSFSTGFKKDPKAGQRFANPHFSMLACTVPDWIMGSLRMDLFTGGLGRRLVIVHCQKEKLVDTPMLPVGGKDALERVVKHLKTVEEFYGRFEMDLGAKAWWKTWYYDKTRFNREDPILMQFHETKHVQLLKVALLLAMNQLPLKRIIEERHLRAAHAMLGRLENDIVRLTSGIGRNELAAVGNQLIDFLRRNGGVISIIKAKKVFYRYVQTPEWVSMIQHYKETGQIVEMQDKNTGFACYALPETYEQIQQQASQSPNPNNQAASGA